MIYFINNTVVNDNVSIGSHDSRYTAQFHQDSKPMLVVHTVTGAAGYCDTFLVLVLHGTLYSIISHVFGAIRLYKRSEHLIQCTILHSNYQAMFTGPQLCYGLSSHAFHPGWYQHYMAPQGRDTASETELCWKDNDVKTLWSCLQTFPTEGAAQPEGWMPEWAKDILSPKSSVCIKVNKQIQKQTDEGFFCVVNRTQSVAISEGRSPCLLFYGCIQASETSHFIITSFRTSLQLSTVSTNRGISSRAAMAVKAHFHAVPRAYGSQKL